MNESSHDALPDKIVSHMLSVTKSFHLRDSREGHNWITVFSYLSVSIYCAHWFDFDLDPTIYLLFVCWDATSKNAFCVRLDPPSPAFHLLPTMHIPLIVSSCVLDEVSPDTWHVIHQMYVGLWLFNLPCVCVRVCAYVCVCVYVCIWTGFQHCTKVWPQC